MLVLALAAVSGAITLAAALFPRLELVYHVPALHVAFQTAGALIALLAGLVIAGRFVRRARLGEVILASSLGGLALCELAFATVPAGPGGASTELAVWAALAGRTVAAVLFALAVFMPDRRLHRPGFALAVGAAAVAMTPLLIAGAAVWLAPKLPNVSVTATGLAVNSHSGMTAGAFLARSELWLTMIYALAAAGFLRHAERNRDEFSGWLAAAAILAAASHLNYVIYPATYTQLVSLGDMFRLCSYAVLLAGSAREISSYWQAVPAAVINERRAAARDLQERVAPELAYLVRNLGSLDGAVNTDTAAQLRQAVERAQLEARLAIGRLGGPFGTVNEDGSGIVGVPMARTAYGRWRLGFRPLVFFLGGARQRQNGEYPSLSQANERLAAAWEVSAALARCGARLPAGRPADSSRR